MDGLSKESVPLGVYVQESEKPKLKRCCLVTIKINIYI